MLKGIQPSPTTDQTQVKALTAALLDLGKKTDASHKELAAALRALVMAAPEIRVVHHETQHIVPTSPTKAKKWTFTVHRDGDGKMTHITAESD